MSVLRITVTDLALVELLDGETAAPPDVLGKLEARGLVAITAGKAALTPKGRRRGESLRPCAHDLRLMFGAGAAGRGSSALHTDAAGGGLHVGGGRAHVRG